MSILDFCNHLEEEEKAGSGKKNLFLSIKNSGEILNKLKSRGFLAAGLSKYDFSTLYIHCLIIKSKKN